MKTLVLAATTSAAQSATTAGLFSLTLKCTPISESFIKPQGEEQSETWESLQLLGLLFAATMVTAKVVSQALELTMSDSVVVENDGGFSSGGLFLSGTATIMNTTIARNSGRSAGSTFGGGMHILGVTYNHMIYM